MCCLVYVVWCLICCVDVWVYFRIFFVIVLSIVCRCGFCWVGVVMIVLFSVWLIGLVGCVVGSVLVSVCIVVWVSVVLVFIIVRMFVVLIVFLVLC